MVLTLTNHLAIYLSTLVTPPISFIQASKLDRFGDVSRLILVQQQEFIELKEIKD